MEAWREELYHHGILGMRWGKRNGPPYPLGASDHSASEKKAGWRKSLDNPQKTTGLALRIQDRREGRRETKEAIRRNVKNAKGIVNKASELVGHGRSRTEYEIGAKTQQKLAEHSKTKLGKHLHETKSTNYGYNADYHNRVKNLDLGERLVNDLIVNKELINTKYQRLSGRTTNYGRMAVDNLLTAGIAGLAMDAKYIRDQKKKNKKPLDVDASIAKNKTTKRVADDYHKLSDSEFKGKYQTSKQTFAKRYNKTKGDTYSLGLKKQARAVRFLDRASGHGRLFTAADTAKYKLASKAKEGLANSGHDKASKAVGAVTNFEMRNRRDWNSTYYMPKWARRKYGLRR